MKPISIAVTVSSIFLFATAAFAAPKGGQPGSGNNPGGNGQGFVSETFTQQTTQQFMGMSDKTPPNAHAAASQGTRTETTTESVTVNGPKGQVDGYDPFDASSSCNNCTETDRTSTTETTDLPGANR